MDSIEKRARSIVTEAGTKLSPIEYIKRSVAEMDPRDVESLAVAYLYVQVKNRKRAHVLGIERQTARKAPSDAAVGRLVSDREKALRSTKRGTPWAGIVRAMIDGRDTLDIWEENNVGTEEMAKREAALAEREQIAKAQYDRFQKIMDDYKQSVIMEWTEELLGSEFALGDGTTTTWGEATRDQHAARMAMYKRNAIAGMDGYARHAAAVQELDARGVSTLREALAVAA